jgi:hypothetical protein
MEQIVFVHDLFRLSLLGRRNGGSKVQAEGTRKMMEASRC